MPKSSKIKSLLWIWLMIITLLPIWARVTTADNDIKLYINGSRLESLSTPAVIYDSRTLVPARDVFEGLGALVEWNAAERAVYIAYKGTLVILTIDSPVATVNGKDLVMDVPPMIMNDRTMIPVRFPAESFDFEVLWADAERAVYINTPAEPTPTTTPTPTATPTPAAITTPTPTAINTPTPTPDTADPLPPGAAKDVTTQPPDKIDAETTDISAILPPKSGTANSYTITATSSITDVQYFLLEDNRLVVDIYNARYRIQALPETDPGLPVNAVRASQFMDVPPVVRVVFEIAGAADYALTLSADRKALYVTFTRSGGADIAIPTPAPVFPLDGAVIAYDPASRTVIIPKHADAPFNIADIAHEDRYWEKSYTFVLPVYAADFLVNVELIIHDAYLQSVVVEKDAPQTRLVFYETQILAFDVYEDAANIYIKALLPREKYDRIVIIDPGHGGVDPGALANGLVEKELNLSVALMVIQLLDTEGTIKAYATRVDDSTFAREERPDYANALGDMFVSIHHNSMDNNTTISGTETYYYPHANDYTIGLSSQALADIIHNRLLIALKYADRKVKNNNYIVLRYTEIPAVLCEIGFITNAAEAARVSSSEYQWKAAHAIAEGIKEAFGLYTPKR